MEKTASEIWNGAWPQNLHSDDFAKKRIVSAKSVKLTPVQINEEDKCGYFMGAHGRYETFLDTCTCGDFRRSKRPCKHIYRLAMELRVLNEEFETNSNSILIPMSERLPLDTIIDMVEELTEKLQRRLYSISCDCDSSVKETTELDDEELDELLQSGIIIDCPGRSKTLKFRSMRQLKSDLDSLGLPYDKQLKAKELKDFCSKTYYDELSKIYPVLRMVMFPPEISPRKVHQYLARKYGSSAFDVDGENYELIPRLETSLPNDEITQQLIKRGFYDPAYME